MEKYLVHSLIDAEYAELITVLDYEMRLYSYLSKLVFPKFSKGKKAIVDLALKSGLDKYRFVSFDIDRNGRLVIDSNKYVDIPDEIKTCANGYLKEQKEIVLNSFLSREQKKRLLNG